MSGPVRSPAIEFPRNGFRPINSWSIFRTEMAGEIRDDPEHLPQREISKLISKKWKGLTDEERAAYPEQAVQAKEQQKLDYPDEEKQRAEKEKRREEETLKSRDEKEQKQMKKLLAKLELQETGTEESGTEKCNTDKDRDESNLGDVRWVVYEPIPSHIESDSSRGMLEMNYRRRYRYAFKTVCPGNA